MKLVTLEELNIPTEPTIISNHFLSEIYSTKGGLTKSTINLVYGSPGAGKSTICLDYVANLIEENKDIKVCFISAEMNEIQFSNISKIVPSCVKIPTIFFDQWKNSAYNPEGESPLSIFSQILNEGFDLILIDSYNKLRSILKLSSSKFDMSMTYVEVENLILDLMKKSSSGDNKSNVNTAFIVIQQQTKDGSMAGKNSLAHDVDSILEVNYDQKKKGGKRTLSFKKNRFSPASIPVEFNITENGVEYNRESFYADKEFYSLVDENNKASEEENEFLNSLLTEKIEDSSTQDEEMINLAFSENGHSPI